MKKERKEEERGGERKKEEETPNSSLDNHLPVRNEKGPSRYDLVHYILGD